MISNFCAQRQIFKEAILFDCIYHTLKQLPTGQGPLIVDFVYNSQQHSSSPPTWCGIVNSYFL